MYEGCPWMFETIIILSKGLDIIQNKLHIWYLGLNYLIAAYSGYESGTFWRFIPPVRRSTPHSASVYCTASLICGAPSEFVSSSIPSWQILTAHAQPFRGARDLAFCLKVPLDSLLVWASSGGSGETAWMRRLAWTFAARIGDKIQIRLTRPKWTCYNQ